MTAIGVARDRVTAVQIALLLFDGMTTLDAVGPYDVLNRLPGARVRFVAAERGPRLDDHGALALVATHSLEEVPRPDVLLVPGGLGTRRLIHDEALLDWIRSAHESTRYTCSVCTGSLLLAAAGVLDRVDATTHWAARDLLRELGARPSTERVVERGKIMTAAGVSSGIDMALRLAEHLAGAEVAQAIQLSIEYDPEPPHDAGSPDKAGPEVMNAVARLQRWVPDERSGRLTPSGEGEAFPRTRSKEDRFMGLMDKISGRAKKAAGDVAGDSSLRSQGRKEERKGEAKEQRDRAHEQADEKAQEVADLEKKT